MQLSKSICWRDKWLHWLARLFTKRSMLRGYRRRVMQRIRLTFFSALTALALAIPAVASAGPPNDEQNDARRDLRAGNVHSLRDIERQVLPTMRGMQYLGPEYDPEAMAYRLKFIRDGRVVFVDVDARTGQVRGHNR